LEEQAMMRFEQAVGNMDWEIGVDPDQVGTEGAWWISLTEAIRDDWLPKLLVRVHDDVSGICQPRLGDMRDRTATSVVTQDGISERCLVRKPRFDLSEGIATLGRGWERGLGGSSYDHPECEFNS
jgi:hypothetical protein